jgi:hypothetical protein
MLKRRAKLMREPSMRNDEDTDHVAPRMWSPAKGAIFVG